jgi:hypothetical protein
MKMQKIIARFSQCRAVVDSGGDTWLMHMRHARPRSRELGCLFASRKEFRVLHCEYARAAWQFAPFNVAAW